MVGVLVGGIGAQQHIARGLNRIWGDSTAKAWRRAGLAQWWERPRLPEALFTEEQGSPRHEDGLRARPAGAGGVGWGGSELLGTSRPTAPWGRDPGG